MFEANETSEQRKKRLARERKSKSRKKQKNDNTEEIEIIKASCTSPILMMCCANGKIHLPPLLQPPPYILDLYTSSASNADSFFYHRIGQLLPDEGHSPTFAQLYIYDTAHESQN
ncbi:4007_t:CDS:2 [Funneliformis mosseae]|uniref:4007_t:CDS:1 n=1 Tax=Funneliformis mosseae TaxID=27381 RepID=A0A9N9DX96_FUNMO|nr:4007_t:CDS:2 [Funneliformis mosseae]